VPRRIACWQPEHGKPSPCQNVETWANKSRAAFLPGKTHSELCKSFLPSAKLLLKIRLATRAVLLRKEEQEVANTRCLYKGTKGRQEALKGSRRCEVNVK